MAVTGFWPVRGSLKDVINYADNPDKTTKNESIGNDLSAAIQYVENESKTDHQVYVGGINCTRDHAYEEMVAVQKHFGNRGRVIAYHGIQSFPSGEVTPEEAFEIGKETARDMWGDKYQVLVTVHLNTDNVHCHFVLNPISFVDGSKYHNKISEHKRLREVSDRICMRHEKTVLENSGFYGGEKKAYWIHQKGQKTHRDQLKEDVAECLRVSHHFAGFVKQLKSMGYEIDTQRMSVKAKGWQRSVRLRNIGFTNEVIRKQLEENLFSPDVLVLWNNHLPYKPKVFPLESELRKLEFSLTHAYDPATILVDTMFLLLITLFRIIDGLPDVIFMSPDLRYEKKNLQQYISDYHLLRSEGVHTIPELQLKIEETEAAISEQEHLRSKADNKKRRANSHEEKTLAKKERAAITQHITPLRKKLKHLQQIQDKAPVIYDLIRQEHLLEQKALERSRERIR